MKYLHVEYLYDSLSLTGMAQFLDFDMDSDEDFEESVQQGTF